jgi:hypothetical protein
LHANLRYNLVKENTKVALVGLANTITSGIRGCLANFFRYYFIYSLCFNSVLYVFVRPAFYRWVINKQRIRDSPRVWKLHKNIVYIKVSCSFVYYFRWRDFNLSSLVLFHSLFFSFHSTELRKSTCQLFRRKNNRS